MLQRKSQYHNFCLTYHINQITLILIKYVVTKKSKWRNTLTYKINLVFFFGNGELKKGVIQKMRSSLEVPIHINTYFSTFSFLERNQKYI